MDAAKNEPFYLFGTYLWRWLLWGVISGFLLTEGDNRARGIGAVEGLVGGLICAVVFTLAQNMLNTPRKRWMSWVVLLSTLVLYKLASLLLLSQLLPPQ